MLTWTWYIVVNFAEGPIISDSPPVTGRTVNPGKPGKECGKGSYSRCSPKPAPKCNKPYNCRGPGAAP